MSKHPYEYKRHLHRLGFTEIDHKAIVAWLAGAFEELPSTEQFKYMIDKRRLVITFAYDPSTGRVWAHQGIVNLSPFGFMDMSLFISIDLLPVPNDEKD